MDRLTKPYRECCLHSNPTHVYDLTGWDAQNKLYRLENDHGHKVFVRSHEFTLISNAGEDLIRATEQGEIVKDDVKTITIEDLMAGGFTAQPIDGQDIGIPDRVFEREATGAQTSATRPEVRPTRRESKGGASDAAPEAVEAKATVRRLLADCQTREEIAGVAQPILLESVEYLIGKYAHLDNGRFRMTIGNRMVGVLKKNPTLLK
jgi:hypothetical protein